ncbi:MAG: type pilus assembly protein PilX, partial [Betaproteobacteria bacterium]|nr:type pilus assembly protein PilX [Betaproteobacteria bacterium]
ANSGGTALYNDDNMIGVGSKGYWSSSPVTERPWMDLNTWNNAAVVNAGNPDASGNVVSYIVERMCRNNNVAPDATCGSTPDNTAISGEGVDLSGANFFTRPPATHYRITAKSTGPRNSITIVQTLVRTQ